MLLTTVVPENLSNHKNTCLCEIMEFRKLWPNLQAKTDFTGDNRRINNCVWMNFNESTTHIFALCVAKRQYLSSFPPLVMMMQPAHFQKYEDLSHLFRLDRSWDGAVHIEWEMSSVTMVIAKVPGQNPFLWYINNWCRSAAISIFMDSRERNVGKIKLSTEKMTAFMSNILILDGSN